VAAKFLSDTGHVRKNRQRIAAHLAHQARVARDEEEQFWLWEYLAQSNIAWDADVSSIIFPPANAAQNWAILPTDPSYYWESYCH
jgi:hypothetical protein